MTSSPSLLSVRAKMKAHQPLFVVKEYHKSARIKKRWRAQRGIHSGHRQMHRGKPAQPTPGFGTPREVRGMHSSGLQPVAVHSTSQLDAIDPQTQGLLIGATVGAKKKLQILELALKKKITLLQVADAQKAITAIQSAFSARVKSKQDHASTKSKKEMEKKKKAEKKKEETAKPELSMENPRGSLDGSLDDTVAQKEIEQEQKEAEKTLIKPQ